MRYLSLSLSFSIVIVSGSLALFLQPDLAVGAETDKPIEGFSLRDFRGKEHKLDE